MALTSLARVEGFCALYNLCWTGQSRAIFAVICPCCHGLSQHVVSSGRRTHSHPQRVRRQHQLALCDFCARQRARDLFFNIYSMMVFGTERVLGPVEVWLLLRSSPQSLWGSGMISSKGHSVEVLGFNLNLSPRVCRFDRGWWAQTVACLVTLVDHPQVIGFAWGGGVSPNAIWVLGVHMPGCFSCLRVARF